MRNRLNIVSVDVECDGPNGVVYAIGAVVQKARGTEIARFIGKLPDSQVEDPWVRARLLSAIADVSEVYQQEAVLIAAFREFYERHGNGSVTITHLGSGLARNMLKRVIGTCEGVRLVDIDFVVQARLDNLPPANQTVHDYAKRYRLSVGNGHPNNPLHDAIVAAAVYRHTQRARRR